MKKNISPVGRTGQEGEDVPIQVSVDKQHILFGKMSLGQISPQIAIYYPGQNKFTHSEHVSGEEQNSMVIFEGFQKDFFADIWKEYLDSLPVDFEVFYVQSLVVDMHFFNEALFFYLYGAFKFRSLQFFKDNFQIIRRDFFWEDPRQAEAHFERLQNPGADESSEKDGGSEKMPDLSLTLEDPLGSELERQSSNEDEIPRLPSGIEESEDEDFGRSHSELMARIEGERAGPGGLREALNQKGYVQIEETHSFEKFRRGRKADARETPESKQNLLKDKFSAIEEESFLNDLSRETSRTDSMFNLTGVSRQRTGESGLNKRSLEGSLKAQLRTTVETEVYSEMNRDKRNTRKVTSIGEYSGFLKKKNLEYEEVSNAIYSSNKRDQRSPKNDGFVSKSLKLFAKEEPEEGPTETGDLRNIGNDFSQSEETVSVESDLIAKNLHKIRNSFRESRGKPEEYESDFNRSSNFGFNKYIQSSSRIASSTTETPPAFELETGRMSQSHCSEANSKAENTLDVDVRESFPRRGSVNTKDEVEIEIENETLDGVEEIQTDESYRGDSGRSLDFDSVDKPRAHSFLKSGPKHLFDEDRARGENPQKYQRSRTEKKLNDKNGQKSKTQPQKQRFSFLKGDILETRSGRLDSSEEERRVNRNDDSMLSQGSSYEISQNFKYSFADRKKLKKSGPGSQSMQDFSRKGFPFISHQKDSEVKARPFHSKHLNSMREHHFSRITANESILEEVGYEDDDSSRGKKKRAFLGRLKAKKKKPVLYKNKRRKKSIKGKSRSPLTKSRSKSKLGKSKAKRGDSSNNSFTKSTKKGRKDLTTPKKSKAKGIKKYKTKPVTSGVNKSRTPAKRKNKSANKTGKGRAKKKGNGNKVSNGSLDQKKPVPSKKSRGKLDKSRLSSKKKKSQVYASKNNSSFVKMKGNSKSPVKTKRSSGITTPKKKGSKPPFKKKRTKTSKKQVKK